MKIVEDIELLRKKSSDVETVEEAESIIDSLKSTLQEHGDGLGLSAIQIGIAKKISIIRHGEDFIPIINPVVVEKRDPFKFSLEGCLSIPGVYQNTLRYKHFIIKCLDIEDGKFRESTKYFYFEHERRDISAIVVQHEIDHFDGKLILDHKADLVEFGKTAKVDAKVGRNDPCPCGKMKDDGKPMKFKNCCGKNR